MGKQESNGKTGFGKGSIQKYYLTSTPIYLKRLQNVGHY